MLIVGNSRPCPPNLQVSVGLPRYACVSYLPHAWVRKAQKFTPDPCRSNDRPHLHSLGKQTTHKRVARVHPYLPAGGEALGRVLLDGDNGNLVHARLGLHQIHVLRHSLLFPQSERIRSTRIQKKNSPTQEVEPAHFRPHNRAPTTLEAEGASEHRVPWDTDGNKKSTTTRIETTIVNPCAVSRCSRLRPT